MTETTDVPMDSSKKDEEVPKNTDDEKTEPPRCKKCRRMTSGHEGPYGSKCELKSLTSEELEDDDKEKMKAKEIKKHQK